MKISKSRDVLLVALLLVATEVSAIPGRRMTPDSFAVAAFDQHDTLQTQTIDKRQLNNTLGNGNPNANPNNNGVGNANGRVTQVLTVTSTSTSTQPPPPTTVAPLTSPAMSATNQQPAISASTPATNSPIQSRVLVSATSSPATSSAAPASLSISPQLPAAAEATSTSSARTNTPTQSTFVPPPSAVIVAESTVTDDPATVSRATTPRSSPTAIATGTPTIIDTLEVTTVVLVPDGATVRPSTSVLLKTVVRIGTATGSTVAEVTAALNAASQSGKDQGGLSQSNKNIIIGVVAGVGGFIVLAGLGALLYRMRRRDRGDEYHEPKERTSSEPSYGSVGGNGVRPNVGMASNF